MGKILRIVSQLPLLDVLLYWSVGLVGGHLHLGACVLGDLDDKIEHTIAQVQGDVVPRRDLFPGAVEEEDSVVEGLRLAFFLDLDVGLVEGSGGEQVPPGPEGGGGLRLGKEGAVRQRRCPPPESMEGAGGSGESGGRCGSHRCH